MSKRYRNMEESNLIKIQEPLASRLKELAKDTRTGFHEYVNEILDEYVRERRSGKPPQLPEERFTERNAEREWDGVYL